MVDHTTAALICHEAERHLRNGLGETPVGSWGNLPKDHRERLTQIVGNLLEGGPTAESLSSADPFERLVAHIVRGLQPAEEGRVEQVPVEEENLTEELGRIHPELVGVEVVEQMPKLVINAPEVTE